MSSIRHAVDLYMTYVSASSVLRTSRSSLADNATHCARSYDIRLCDLRTEHGAKPDDIETTLGSVAKTDGVHKTLGSVPSWRRAYCAGRETLCRQYDNTSLCTFIRHTSSRRA